MRLDKSHGTHGDTTNVFDNGDGHCEMYGTMDHFGKPRDEWAGRSVVRETLYKDYGIRWRIPRPYLLKTTSIIIIIRDSAPEGSD